MLDSSPRVEPANIKKCKVGTKDDKKKKGKIEKVKDKSSNKKIEGQKNDAKDDN